MFNLELLPVTPSPFPHVAVEDFLDSDAYRALHDSFPPCPANSGPTGYSIFIGDPAYDELIAGNAAWRKFHALTQSQPFVESTLAPFQTIFAQEAQVDLSRAKFASHVETRAEKELRRLPPAGLEADALFVRNDILQGNVGYARQPHVDHRRRAVSMLIYFCDGDEDNMVGGDLLLHGQNGVERTIRPRHNRMVLFPCTNGSVHSVPKIISQTAPRNYVQIAVSSSVDLWRSPPDRLSLRPLSRLKSAFDRRLRQLATPK